MALMSPALHLSLGQLSPLYTLTHMHICLKIRFHYDDNTYVTCFTLTTTSKTASHTLSLHMPPPSSLSHITILGAGLSGLTAAYRLSQQCPTTRITLLDSADRIGGWIKSTKYRLQVDNGRREGDVYLESGPRSIRPKGSPGAAGMLKLVSCASTSTRASDSERERGRGSGQ